MLQEDDRLSGSPLTVFVAELAHPVNATGHSAAVGDAVQFEDVAVT